MEKGLGLRVQEARKTAGLTQQQLCQKAGLSYSTLAKIERGAIKSPSVFTIFEIASVVGTTVDELLEKKSPNQVAKKRSKSGVEFVYFDINGCLVHFYHRAFGTIASDTGVSSDTVETIYWHYNDAVCRGDISLSDFNQKMAQELHSDSFDWSTYYLDALEPITETRNILEFAEEHYRIGLLSNIMPGLIKGLMERKYIPKLAYDAIIDSSEVKAIKPEPAIFEIATKKAGVSPESILLIDDSRANLIAAEQHGWRVLWFDDYRPKDSVDRIRSALEY